MQLLLEHETDITFEDDNGNTALECAASREQTKVARLLLEKGASVSHKNKQGQTALFQELNTSIWSLTFILRIAYQDIDLFAQRDKKTGEVVLTLQLQLKRAKSRQKRKRP